jgi:putative FmdB family regulatory protein
MPTYVYQCSCGKRQDAVRTIAERNDCPRCSCGGATERRITAPLAVRAFTPYRTAVFDKEAGRPMEINSKAEHESFLRRNGFEEVGNDQSMAPLPQEEIAHRRAEKLKEQGSPEYAFNEQTHEATLETTP